MIRVICLYFLESIRINLMPLKEKLNRKQRFDLLLRFTSNKDNLDYKKYNDIPFFIVPYEISEQNKIKFEDIPSLEYHLIKNDIKHLSINLYELSLELLDNNLDDLKYFLETEAARDKKRFIEDLQGVLTSQKVAEKIGDKCEKLKPELLLISGVGEVFPYLRLSKLLENLSCKVKEIVVLIFFPGIYCQSDDKGTYLRLFSCLDYDHHYRAFNIEDLNL